MKIIFDKDNDILNLIFRDDPISESDDVKDGIIVDFNKEGKIVSMEILDASENIFSDTKFFF